MQTLPRRQIDAALRTAAARGFNPYDSHTVQAKVFANKWRMDTGRTLRSEFVANRELSK